MATLKKLTRMGADVRQIARLLQAKAPEGHMLAYITPEEADLLKSRGGSGKEHENTGVPSFEVGDYGDYSTISSEPAPMPQEQIQQQLSYQGPPSRLYTYDDLYVSPEVSGFGGIGGYGGYGKAQTSPYINPPSARVVSPLTPQGDVNSEPIIGYVAETNVAPAPAPVSTPQAPYVPYDMSFGTRVDVPGERLPSAMTMGAGETQAIDTAREPTLSERLQSYYKDMKPETLQRLGLAGGLGLLSAYQSNKAQREAEAAKREQQKLGEPYQQKGAELQRAAQAGELTPQSQQALQAVQAQAAQQASRGGAVGQAQIQAQVEAFRQQLLQQQYDYGLKLSGIGDQIALGAIKTGMQADQYVNQLTSSYYNNIARTLYGAPPAQQTQAGATYG